MEKRFYPVTIVKRVPVYVEAGTAGEAMKKAYEKLFDIDNPAFVAAQPRTELDVSDCVDYCGRKFEQLDAGAHVLTDGELTTAEDYQKNYNSKLCSPRWR